eukprot:155875-Chlamydomonas_euryale.AAC.2
MRQEGRRASRWEDGMGRDRIMVSSRRRNSRTITPPECGSSKNDNHYTREIQTLQGVVGRRGLHGWLCTQRGTGIRPAQCGCPLCEACPVWKPHCVRPAWCERMAA